MERPPCKKGESEGNKKNETLIKKIKYMYVNKKLVYHNVIKEFTLAASHNYT